jgi:hypothetical protein
LLKRRNYSSHLPARTTTTNFYIENLRDNSITKQNWMMKKYFLYEKVRMFQVMVVTSLLKKKKLQQPFTHKNVVFFVNSTRTTTTNFDIENIRNNSTIRYENYLYFLLKGVLLPQIIFVGSFLHPKKYVAQSFDSFF